MACALNVGFYFLDLSATKLSTMIMGFAIVRVERRGRRNVGQHTNRKLSYPIDWLVQFRELLHCYNIVLPLA